MQIYQYHSQFQVLSRQCFTTAMCSWQFPFDQKNYPEVEKQENGEGMVDNWP